MLYILHHIFFPNDFRFSTDFLSRVLGFESRIPGAPCAHGAVKRTRRRRTDGMRPTGPAPPAPTATDTHRIPANMGSRTYPPGSLPLMVNQALPPRYVAGGG